MFKLLVRLLKACRCKVFICCKSKCSLGENDEITIENLNVENNINNNYNDEVVTNNQITSDI
jgi:hypothetical protein